MIRNIECPYYQKCLDQAATANIKAWDCLSCKHLKEKKDHDPTDFFEYRLFLLAIFKPGLWRKYNELRALFNEDNQGGKPKTKQEIK